MTVRPAGFFNQDVFIPIRNKARLKGRGGILMNGVRGSGGAHRKYLLHETSEL
jgi:hypothetical protein